MELVLQFKSHEQTLETDDLDSVAPALLTKIISLRPHVWFHLTFHVTCPSKRKRAIDTEEKI